MTRLDSDQKDSTSRDRMITQTWQLASSVLETGMPKINKFDFHFVIFCSWHRVLETVVFGAWNKPR